MYERLTLPPVQPVMTVGSGGVAYPTGRNLGPAAGGGYPGQQLLQVCTQSDPRTRLPPLSLIPKILLIYLITHSLATYSFTSHTRTHNLTHSHTPDH